MSLYRPTTSFAAPSAGVSNDGADGANKALENVLTSANMLDAPGAGKEAAQLWAQARSGFITVSDPVCDKVLPKVDITGMNGAEQGFQGLADMIGKMANPLSFLHAIIEFFKALFTTAAVQVMDGMHHINLYNQAAEAALEATKKAA